jgi:hypothetical protein
LSTNTSDSEFKAILESQHDFPGNYLFKFVAPQDKKEQILTLFNKGKISTKQSSKGNYISVTVELFVESSDEVITIYRQAHEIGGVLSL